jgi:hypothetical protein
MILDNTTTEDKLAYCKEASDTQEPLFVEFLNNLDRCNFKAEINPDKETNPYTHDLIVNGYSSDLKTQDTPFFKANKLYNIDPQWAITYNHKDYMNYKKKYTNNNKQFLIFFDVTRKNEEMFGVNTFAMRAIFVAKASEIELIIESAQVPLHEYINRKDDQKGNAKSSYVIDVRKFSMIYYSGKSISILP